MVELEQDNSHEAYEDVVQQYLSETLDTQVGSSEARFRQFLGEEEVPASRQSVFRLPIRFGGWTLGIAGMALAASLGALWAGPSLRQVAPARSISAPQVNTTPVSNPLVVEQDMQSQTFDEGMYMLDHNTPVRVLRRHDVERTRWFDQNRKLQGEQLVPQDHVVYVQVKTY